MLRSTMLNLFKKTESSRILVASSFYHDKLVIGQDHIRKRNLSEAIEIFNQIIRVFEENFQEQLTPYLVEAYFQKSLALSKTYNKDSLDQSVGCLKKVLELEPSHELAKEKMDAILFDRGELPVNRLY